jgi:hypothetical protein
MPEISQAARKPAANVFDRHIVPTATDSLPNAYDTCIGRIQVDEVNDNIESSGTRFNKVISQRPTGESRLDHKVIVAAKLLLNASQELSAGRGPLRNWTKLWKLGCDQVGTMVWARSFFEEPAHKRAFARAIRAGDDDQLFGVHDVWSVAVRLESGGRYAIMMG